jgi:hypothetical protein
MIDRNEISLGFISYAHIFESKASLMLLLGTAMFTISSREKVLASGQENLSSMDLMCVTYSFQE